MGDEMLSLLETELGTVITWEEECPGVYYLSVQPNQDTNNCPEYYVVVEKSSLPRDVLALGTVPDSAPCRLYAIDPPKEGAWTAVLYKLCKYRLAHDLSAPDGWSLTSIAAKGMELCPSYFGTFPVPPRTPWGWTLKHRALDNGIYWLETSQGKAVLAVCYPIWDSELSYGVIGTGKMLAYAETSTEEEPLSYLFFEKTACCTAILSSWRCARNGSKPD